MWPIVKDLVLHFLSSGFVGLSAFCLTWITWSAFFKLASPSRLSTYSTLVGIGIFLASSSVALWLSWVTHLYMDFGPTW